MSDEMISLWDSFGGLLLDLPSLGESWLSGEPEEVEKLFNIAQAVPIESAPDVVSGAMVEAIMDLHGQGEHLSVELLAARWLRDRPKLLNSLGGIEGLKTRMRRAPGSPQALKKIVLEIQNLFAASKVENLSLELAADPFNAELQAKLFESLHAQQSTDLTLAHRFLESRIDNWFAEDGSVMAPEPRKFVIPGFIPVTVPAMLVATGGTGKGFFEIALGMHIAMGLPYGPFEAGPPSPVIIVSREDSSDEMHRRFKATMDAYFPDGLTSQQLRLLNKNLRMVDVMGIRGCELGPELISQIRRIASEYDQPGVVFLDPLGKLLPDKIGLNSQEDAGRITNELDAIVRATGFTVFATHHTNKAAARDGKPLDVNATSGSHLITDLSRLVIHMARLSAEGAENCGFGKAKDGQYVQIAITKANYTPTLPEPWYMERREGGALITVEGKTPAEIDDEQVFSTLLDFGTWTDRTEWRKESADATHPVAKHRFNKSVGRLERRGRITSRRVKRKKFWAPTPPHRPDTWPEEPEELSA